ncbi:MAG: holo-ACP synthase [Bacillaceae bacterium]|nr:holo-ACP synthase [Bacillaceae bacterium]
MILGTGIDLLEIKRIEQIFKRNQRFAGKILSDREQNLFSHLASQRRKVEFLAGRFAAKEAYAKAAGTGIGKNVAFHHIEILPDKNGKPEIYIDGIKKDGVFLSISHSEQFVVAQVIIEAQSDEG